MIIIIHNRIESAQIDDGFNILDIGKFLTLVRANDSMGKLPLIQVLNDSAGCFHLAVLNDLPWLHIFHYRWLSIAHQMVLGVSPLAVK